MENTQRNNVTWTELRYIVPISLSLIGALITIVFFLAGLMFKIDDMQQQMVDVKLQNSRISGAIDSVKDTVNSQGLDIAVIKQILTHNNLSQTNEKPNQNVASLPLQLGTPSNTSATTTPSHAELAQGNSSPPASSTTNNSTTYIINPTPTPGKNPIQPTVIPPAPTPAPTPIVCIINICI